MAWKIVRNWQALATVHSTRPDPYCIWAEVNGWLSYTKPDRLHPASVIIELERGEDFAAFLGCVANDIAVAPDYLGTLGTGAETFITASVTHDGLAELANPAPGRAGSYVKRFDLCDYIEPNRAPTTDEQMRRGNRCVPADTVTTPPIAAAKIIGIIDDGCAFAHASFLTGDGSTRVAALWDQDATPAFAAAKSQARPHFGTPPYKFLGGREIWRGDAPDGRWLGLDRWLSRYRYTQKDLIDEDACYGEANCEALRALAVHGPHVMDVLAGPRDAGACYYTDPDTPPSWRQSTDAAADPARSDIVFVQLPHAGLQDRSGGWLDSHVLDALRYILGCKQRKTQQAVVTLSYGSTVGPHDGSSILSGAIAALKTAHGSSFDVVMAAGNSFASRGHAQIDLAEDNRVLRWRVLPGGETPSFLQAWMPQGSKAQIRVAPPGHKLASMAWIAVDTVATWPALQGPIATIVNLAVSSRGDGAMALIAIAPTEQAKDPAADPRDAAPHGEWQIEFSADRAQGVIHAYIARNDMGLNLPLRGQQSYFQDDDDVDRYLRSPIDDADAANADDLRLFGASSRRGVAVRRRGTINGIATGAAPVVVAGYQRNFSADRGDGTHARYSSAGQSSGSGPGPRGRRPTTSVPTDESSLLPGIRAAGSRSGVTFRLVGTSVGAPQHARALLAGPAIPPPPPSRGSRYPGTLPPPSLDPDLDGTG